MLEREDLELIGNLIEVAVKATEQHIYAELADSLKEAGDHDHYEFASIEEQAGKAGCRLAGDRISWLVES